MTGVVLVTGASAGLGLMTAEEFAKRGYKVYGTTRNYKKQGEIKNFEGGGFIETVCLDVRDRESCRKAVRYVTDKEGRIDILVNNAGFGVAGPVELTSDDEMKDQFETNFFGVVRMCQEVLPHMRSLGGGRIINVSSVAACIPIPFQAMYSAGKAAVESFSHALSMEVKKFGIKITSIEFGDMKTDFTKNRQKVKGAIEDESGDRIYTDVFNKSLSTMERDEQKGPTPEGAARLIYKVASKKHPKPLVVHRAVYKLVAAVRRILPVRMSNYIISKLYT